VNINEILEIKNKELSLTKEEIDFVIYSYNRDKINDAKMIDFLKLINETNFSYEETYYLANAMASTGEKLEISKNVGFVIDKHSAGSISDPTTLIFMSVLATLGVRNVKVLSSDFGEFGSSLARFKGFKNFDAKISKEKLYENIKNINFGVLEETGEIAPIDKKIYNLRKRANIVSVPLVAASILSKKIATGASAVIYDVKTGEGAIFPSEKFANELANYLVNSTKLAGIMCASVITNLDQPLGASIGLRTELEETIAVLRSERAFYDAKLLDVAKELVIVALCLTGVTAGRSDASKLFDEAIVSGKALDNFRALIKTYGGVYEDFKHTSQRLLNGVAISYITAKEDGYITDIILQNLIDAYKIINDKHAGIVLLVREGSRVKTGDKLMRVFYSIDNKTYFDSINSLYDSIIIGKTKPLKPQKTFHKIIL